MTKAPKQDDPSSMLTDQARALAEENRLIPYLDQIIEAERLRNEASDIIRTLWKQIGHSGFDVAEARRKLVWHACR